MSKIQQLYDDMIGAMNVEGLDIPIAGVKFYQHGETPGLGGEIAKNWFKDNFKGKKIISQEGELVSITIVKGKVKGRIPDDQADHYVDGISGSTLSGNGLNQFLKEDLETYEPYFNFIRKEKTE